MWRAPGPFFTGIVARAAKNFLTFFEKVLDKPKLL
jgi:hypothetical protein